MRCFISLPSLLSSVIEVASGEYGDLNPVLFEAVQRGMCALEEKKNQCENNSSVCATMRQVVRISMFWSQTHCPRLSQRTKPVVEFDLQIPSLHLNVQLWSLTLPVPAADAVKHEFHSSFWGSHEPFSLSWPLLASHDSAAFWPNLKQSRIILDFFFGTYSLIHFPVCQNAGHVESHTFATSTLTQFCILFKRTFVTICRDQVGDTLSQPSVKILQLHGV